MCCTVYLAWFSSAQILASWEPEYPLVIVIVIISYLHHTYIRCCCMYVWCIHTVCCMYVYTTICNIHKTYGVVVALNLALSSDPVPDQHPFVHLV